MGVNGFPPHRTSPDMLPFLPAKQPFSRPSEPLEACLVRTTPPTFWQASRVYDTSNNIKNRQSAHGAFLLLLIQQGACFLDEPVGRRIGQDDVRWDTDVQTIRAILCTRHKQVDLVVHCKRVSKGDTDLGDVPDLLCAVKLVAPCPRVSLELKYTRFAPGAPLAGGKRIRTPRARRLNGFQVLKGSCYPVRLALFFVVWFCQQRVNKSTRYHFAFVCLRTAMLFAPFSVNHMVFLGPETIQVGEMTKLVPL